MVAANRYWRPWSLTKDTTTKGMAPVAAEIMPGRPPANAIMVAILKEAYKPTLGSTPAIIEKAIATGITAKATKSPEITSRRVLNNHVECKRDMQKTNSAKQAARAKRKEK